MNQSEVLIKQIRALHSDTKAKLELLRRAMVENISVNDFLELLNLARQEVRIPEVSKKTASRALRAMELSQLLGSQGGRGRRGKRYFTSDIGLSYLMRILHGSLPTVGWNRTEWNREEIVQSLLMELGRNVISEEDSKEIAQNAEQYMLRLGWGRKNVERPFVRQLVIETIRRIYEKKNKAKYLRMARKFQPIGGTERDIEDYIKEPKKERILASPPEDYAREIYLLRKIERYAPLLMQDYRLGIVYIHGLLNALNPFNFSHDFRWLFSYGIGLPYAPLRKPRDLKSALNFMVHGLTLCQCHIAGSQTLDHWNWIVAPYLSNSEKEVNKLTESFINSLWMQYVAHPRTPLYSNIAVEFIEDCAIADDATIEFNMQAQRSKAVYATYEDQAHSLIDSLLMALATAEELLEEKRWHPSIFLKLSSRSLENLSTESVNAIMNMIHGHHEMKLPHSIYFVNMTSTINKKPGHLTYFRELSRIFVPDPLADSQTAVFTFVTINLLKIIENLKRVGEWKGDFSDLVVAFKKVLGGIFAFNEKKAQTFERNQARGQTGLLSLRNPSTGDPYFKTVDSSIHLGLFGFADAMSYIGLDLQRDLNKLLDFLADLRREATALLSALPHKHQMEVKLAQPPSLSGVHLKLLSQKGIPVQFSHFNLTPHNLDRKTQLSIESKMHEFFGGGAISRIYLNPDEEPACMGFTEPDRNETEIFRKFVLNIIRSSNVPLFQVIPRQKSPKRVYPAMGKLDSQVRRLRSSG